MIKNRKLPVAKLVPLTTDDLEQHERELLAAGKMRLSEIELDVEAFLKMPRARLRHGSAIQALLDDREESL